MCAELLFPPAGSPRFRSGRIHGCRQTTRRRSAPGALRSFPVARLRGGQPILSAAFSGRTRPAPPGKPGGPTPIPETDSPDTGIRLAPERPGAEPFCPAHPAARFSCAVPPQERPGPQASVRSTRPLRPDPPEKKSPAPFRNGRGRGECVCVCGFFIARACRGSLFPR